MWLFNVVPKKERLYWIIMPIFILGIIALASHLFKPIPNKPVLAAKIDVVNIHPAPSDANSTSMILVISVRNSGTPTILEDWSVTTKLEGRTILAENLYLSETMDLEGPQGKITYRRQDAIYTKTVDMPIPQGGMVRGIIWIMFKGIRFDILNRPGTKIEVNFVDVLGSEHVISTSISAIPSRPSYLPGLTIPFKSEKSK